MELLKQKVEEVIVHTKQLKKFSIGNNSEEIERFVMEREIKQIVEDDFMKKNPEEIIDEYFQYFSQKNIPTITIDNQKKYYRARVGYKSEAGADDDWDEEFILPYYDKDIMAPPPLLSTGSRFNREGTSYLYISDDIKTCMAEVHLQVGQLCSVGTFKCKSEIEIIDLTAIQNDIEMEIWLDILTQPVHGNIYNRYNITKFLAEVLRRINGNGIMFNSVQSKGRNIVCYKPYLFELVPYSERLYKAKSITYESEMVEDSVDKYAKQADYHLSTYNENDERRREKVVEHMETWIEHRREGQNDSE